LADPFSVALLVRLVEVTTEVAASVVTDAAARVVNDTTVPTTLPSEFEASAQ